MATTPLKTGSVIEQRYRVESLLGQGGLGTVYRCRDLRNEAPVALKLLRSPIWGEGERTLHSEFSILSRLRHPNLIRILDFGRLEGFRGPYIVQEYVEGLNLFEATAGRPAGQVLEILAQLCRVVQFLHDRGVVHRDLKPGNVLFASSPDGRGQLKVLDFGLAQWLSSEKKQTIEGTLAYMAPEVLMGRGAGPRSDLYSLGILFYQVLARRLPFEDEDPGYLVQKHLQGHADLGPIERLEYGSGLASMTARLLEKEPERRPPSAEEVIRLLGAASGLNLSQHEAPGSNLFFSSGIFVGRENEMALLQQRARQVRDARRGWTVFIVGESGSGKSRCMEELRIWALLEGWRVVQGSCTPIERRLYGPYREILDSTRPPSPDSTRGTQGSRHPPADSRVAATVSHRLVTEATALQFRNQLTNEIVERLSGRPTLVLLHDFHCADEAATAILEYLMSDVLAHPIFLCVSALQAEAEQKPVGRLITQAVRQLRGERLVLDPLPKDAVVQLISSLTGDDQLGQRLGEWVGRNTGGNPFFVEQTLQHLIEREILRREAGRWRIEKFDLNELRAPETVAAVLRRRLSRLSANASELAEWLAVINRPVSPNFLELVIPDGREVIESSLEELVSRQIVRIFEGSEGRTYVFCNASVSEVILEDLPPTRKRQMHGAVGQALEKQTHGVTLVEIASHFMAGHAGEQAVGYALKAEAECKADFAYDMTLRFAKFILEKGRHLPIERLCEIAIDAAEAGSAMGDPNGGVRILKRWLEISKTGPKIVRARLLMQSAHCYQHLGRLRLLDDACRRSLQLLGDDHSELADVTRAIVYRHLAYPTTVRYRRLHGLEFLNKALEALHRHDLVSSPLGGRIYIMIAVAHWTECNYRASIAAAKKAIEILEKTRSDALLSQAHSMLGMSFLALGKFGLARQQQEIAFAIADKSRSVMTRITALGNLAESVYRFGHARAAIAMADQTLELMAEVQNPVMIHEARAVVSEAKVVFGDYSSAREMLGKLSADDRPDLAVHSRGQVTYLNALLDYCLGNTSSSLAHLDALRRLHRQKGPVLEYELGEAIRAAILHSRGFKTEASELLLGLDSTLRRRGWPYHTCIVNLRLGEILLENGELERASRSIEWALKLSRAMPSRHLNTQAHILRARYHRLTSERAAAAGNETACMLSLQKAQAEVGAALKLAEEVGIDDILWQVHAEGARIEERLSDWQAAADHSRKALESLEKAKEKVGAQDAMGFLSSLGRGMTRDECESRLTKIRAMEVRELPRPALLEEAHSRILQQVTRVMGNIRDRDALLESLVDLLIQTVGMERALVFLKEKGTDRLRLAKGRNALQETVKRAEAISRTVLNDVYRRGAPFVTANARTDPRVSTRESVMAFEIGTLFCGPLRVEDRTLGVIYADHPSPLSEISESMIGLFAACCHFAATAIASTEQGIVSIEPKDASDESMEGIDNEYPEIIGQSEAILALRERIASVAASPLDVLIWGESGTGKELVARALHRTSARSKGKLLAVDCGSLSDSLVESEFFGYRKGAFTGAAEDRVGLLESADGGTLFLDEVSNLSTQLQGKLLRVLQEREVRRIGDSVARKIDIRVIAATNRELLEEVRRGEFRQDLYYRLNATEIRVPSLRERLEDVPLLLDQFLNQAAQKTGGPAKSFSPRALELLKRYSYPGNVRELINIVGSGYYTAQGSVIDLEHLPAEIRQARVAELLGLQDDARAREIYQAIRAGNGTFEELVKTPFKGRGLAREVVLGVLRHALAATRGRYKEALKLLGVRESDYQSTMTFLERHGCCADFRPFRQARFLPRDP